jgi:hypothetical protein
MTGGSQRDREGRGREKVSDTAIESQRVERSKAAGRVEEMHGE